MEDKNITNSNSDREGIQTCDLPFMDERKGYKKTKLGWIPEEWETPRIDEVFDFLSTNSLSRNQLNYEAEEGVYNIHYGDIHATYKQPILDFDNENRVPKINKDIVLSQNTDFLKDGDLVIADASEDYEGVGEAIELKNTNGKKVTSGLHTFAFRDKTNETAEGFRVYIFKNLLVKKALKRIATGSKVYGISKGNIQKFKIVLPPLPEQQKIATILSTWDSAIAKQQQLIAAKQQFKKGLMQLLLTGEKRFAGFEGEWEMQEIGKFGKVVSGLTYKPENVMENGDLVLRSSNIQNGKLEFNDNVYINNLEFNPVEKDDILICVRNGSKNLIGKNALITEEIAGVAFGAFMSVFRSTRNRYLKHLFETDLYRKEIHKNLGATINSINSGNLKRFKFLFPQDDDEQQKIASVLSAADREIELLKKELAELQGQKRGLMQKLLTGEKRVII